MNKRIIGFLKYSCCSLSSTLIDLSFFYLFHNQLDYYNIEASIFISSVLSRIFSAFIFYILIRNIVFKPEDKNIKRLFKHLFLEASKLLLSASLLTFADMIIKGNALIEKCCVDSFLFIVFYFAQKLWVFKGENSY